MRGQSQVDVKAVGCVRERDISASVLREEVYIAGVDQECRHLEVASARGDGEGRAEIRGAIEQSGHERIDAMTTAVVNRAVKCAIMGHRKSTVG
jgi:hypothetical protein